MSSEMGHQPESSEELENLLVPNLGYEAKVILAGQQEAGLLLQQRRVLMTGKIIPGLESRRADLGDFFMVFKKRLGKDKLLFLNETFGDDNTFYLGVCKEGFFKLIIETSANTPFEDKMFGNMFGHGTFKYVWNGGTDLRVYRHVVLGGDYEEDVLRSKVETIDFEEGITLVTVRLRELEERMREQYNLYEEGKHTENIRIQNEIEALEEFTAMVPPKEKSSFLRKFFSKRKK